MMDNLETSELPPVQINPLNLHREVEVSLTKVPVEILPIKNNGDVEKDDSSTLSNVTCAIEMPTEQNSSDQTLLKEKVKKKRGRKPKSSIIPIDLHIAMQLPHDSTMKAIDEDFLIPYSGISNECEEDEDDTNDSPEPKRRGRKPFIYDKNDDPNTIKEKRKKRAVELKLKNLQWTLNQSSHVSGKRQKKVPQRFELVPADKRRSFMEDAEGHGESLGSISWIHQQLQSASLYTLRLLHRTIYRKQGMFSDKHIRKTVVKFNGFPFDGTHPEIRKRREQLERCNPAALGSLCDLLALRRASKDVMIDRIIGFLLHPTQGSVDEYLKEALADKSQQHKSHFIKTVFPPSFQPPLTQEQLHQFLLQQSDQEAIRKLCNFTELTHVSSECETMKNNELSGPWNKPSFYSEGNGMKLKYIRAIASNIQAASDGFIELLHRLLYLTIDQTQSMRRNIFEFSGLKCDAGTEDYIHRMRILAILPSEQLKLICKLLCLPTWHRSRQLLSEGILDFLSAPRISVMKKRVPPHFSDEISFSFDTAKNNTKSKIPELKSAESEEIEIVPDIHIPDDKGETGENDYLGIKLKNFSNIHYQVISTLAAKLNDVHMILYMTSTSQNNIRKNILEFAGFPFDETTIDYQKRRNLMEVMNLDELKVVASVLCVSQYIVDESKSSLIDAILKFLLKPSALLNSSTIMPTISPAPVTKRSHVVKKKATSTSKTTPLKNNEVSDIVISNVESLKENPNTSVNDGISSSNISIKEEKIEDVSDIEKLKASMPSDMEITPIPVTQIKIEIPSEADETLSEVKVEGIPAPSPFYESDDDDDRPLSKMIGHPNDDQLRSLVTKIIKESKLDEITMKHVVRKVFDTYPNYDLTYRKEFIKSIVRLVLSQMDDHSCSVTTTVVSV